MATQSRPSGLGLRSRNLEAQELLAAALNGFGVRRESDATGEGHCGDFRCANFFVQAIWR
jgi:hypothetical protein